MWVHYGELKETRKKKTPWERHEVLMTKGYLKTRFRKVDDGKKTIRKKSLYRQ